MSEMNATAPAAGISDVGRTSRCCKSEEERQEINESTCDAREAPHLLAENKQAITRCEEDLKSEFDCGVVALNAHAPIKRLSHEVLCLIFKLHCTDSLPLTLPLNRQVWGALPQITLSHVCSGWREIMLDVPTFWSSIRIVPKRLNTPQSFDSMVKAANTWLSRAKGLLCSIDIDFPEPVCSESWELCMSLWEMDWNKNIINDLISRHKFKRLGVTFADHHLRKLLQLPNDNLSCVEDLCLRYVNPTGDNTTSLLEMDLYKLSNLTSFSLSPNPLNNCSLTDPPPDGYFDLIFGIPWYKLRNIHLHALMPFCLDALKYLGHFAILETCSLVITGDDDDDSDDSDDTFMPSPQVPVHVFQLRELNVTVCSRSRKEEILEFFLLSLRFPKLKSLTLGSLNYGQMSIDLQMLLRVQDASQIHLEELTISCSAPAIDVRTVLTSVPSLRCLELPYKATFTDEAMIEVGAGSIGVFLEDLTIRNVDLDLEKLLRMVKARSRASDVDGKHRNKVNEFKSVTIHCNKAEAEMEDGVLNFIKEIKLSGVYLNVIFKFVPRRRRRYEESVWYTDNSDEPYDDSEEEIYSFL